jgi:hypothetical protein
MMPFPKNLCALLLLLASGCASLSIEMPRHVALRKGTPAEIVGAIESTGTPVGGVDLAGGVLPPGLALEFTREATHFYIRGVPSAPGHYEIDISAWTYGTNFPGKRASAKLSIEVVDGALTR